MPDTRIDQSDSIPSIRLKVPTGTVPVPPVGFGQLHTPSPGVLALRLPDGSVVEVVLAASGGGSGIQVTDWIDVEAAALLALHNTPVSLVAGVAGEVRRAVGADWWYERGATDYTIGGDGNASLAVVWEGTTTHALGSGMNASVLLGSGPTGHETDDLYGFSNGPYDAAGAAAFHVLGKGLVLRNLNGSDPGDPLLDGNGVLHIRLYLAGGFVA